MDTPTAPSWFRQHRPTPIRPQRQEPCLHPSTRQMANNRQCNHRGRCQHSTWGGDATLCATLPPIRWMPPECDAHLSVVHMALPSATTVATMRMSIRQTCVRQSLPPMPLRTNEVTATQSASCQQRCSFRWEATTDWLRRRTGDEKDAATMGRHRSRAAARPPPPPSARTQNFTFRIPLPLRPHCTAGPTAKILASKTAVSWGNIGANFTAQKRAADSRRSTPFYA